MKRLCVAILLLIFSQLDRPLFAFDTLAEQETRADKAKAKYGVTGAGITVAILDRGIDWQNPDFRRPDGTTRIKWLFDMSGQDLCSSSNPAPVEYSAQQINAALMGGATINSRDAVGHGTATAGAAAGSGQAFANGKYAGMAPEADLIIVKLVSEGAPPHDNQPEETPFQGCIDQALEWLDGKVTTLGHPVVALINSGTQWGPIDGTSAVSRKIDAVFGSSRPGRIYVAPSGDEGNVPNHASFSFSDTAGIANFVKGSDQTSYAQIWYSGAAPAQVTITFADGTTVGPILPSSSLSKDGVQVFQYTPGQEFYPWKSTSNDRAVWIQVAGHKGAGQFQIQAIASGTTGKADLYGDLSSPDQFLYCNLCFSDHLTNGRLTDYSATNSAITVGDYVLRSQYVDVNGTLQDLSTEGTPGQLWFKSSDGPTRDGRQGIAITAPGQNTFVSLASNSYWATLRNDLIQDGGGYYVRFGGTSGSAPMVVGVVALMLQLNPNLTADRVRQILQETARADTATSTVPNGNWGFGKIDVLAALDEVAKKRRGQITSQ